MVTILAWATCMVAKVRNGLVANQTSPVHAPHPHEGSLFSFVRVLPSALPATQRDR